ncbi:MAG: hypothetical protein JXQ99_04120 [Hyphomicrobiaceae bacterium]
MKKKPMYRAYVVEDIDEDNSFWTLVGSAFAHTDNKGFNLLLKALPLDGRIVLRRYSETKPDAATATVVPMTTSDETADAS